MAGNLKDILSNLSPDIDPETLLLYLQNRLSQEQRHELEKKLLESDFGGEAEEGLRAFKDASQLPTVVEQLNRSLKNRLRQRRKLKNRIHLLEQPWIYVAAFVIIVLVVISYIVIRRLQAH
ncbi:MAG TPA: hypothetical protein VGC95_11530 [Chitinophagaceae bacterium]